MKSLTGHFSKVCWILLALVVPALAQDGGATASASGMIALGAGLAIGIGTIGPGQGLGNGVGKAMEAIGRNPEAEPKIKNNMLFTSAIFLTKLFELPHKITLVSIAKVRVCVNESNSK